jgi:hypothetical protein
VTSRTKAREAPEPEVPVSTQCAARLWAGGQRCAQPHFGTDLCYYHLKIEAGLTTTSPDSSYVERRA